MGYGQLGNRHFCAYEKIIPAINEDFVGFVEDVQLLILYNYFSINKPITLYKRSNIICIACRNSTFSIFMTSILFCQRD